MSSYSRCADNFLLNMEYKRPRAKEGDIIVLKKTDGSFVQERVQFAYQGIHGWEYKGDSWYFKDAEIIDNLTSSYINLDPHALPFQFDRWGRLKVVTNSL